MARIRRKGIDYFSTDVTLFSDRKIRRLIAQTGAQGVTVLMRVLCEAYKEEGYFVKDDDDLIFDIAEELRIDESAVRSAVDVCVKTGVFDKGMFDKHGIYTSARMQRNYLEATKKRVGRKLNDDFRLVSGAETWVSGAEMGVSGTETGVSGVRSTQSKAKHSKEKNSKAQKSTSESVRVSYAPNVQMEPQEHDALVGRYGQAQTDRMIEMLSNYKGAHGREYENDYYAILSWVVRRYNENAPAMQNERETGSYDHLALDPFADDGEVDTG